MIRFLLSGGPFRFQIFVLGMIIGAGLFPDSTFGIKCVSCVTNVCYKDKDVESSCDYCSTIAVVGQDTLYLCVSGPIKDCFEPNFQQMNQCENEHAPDFLDRYKAFAKCFGERHHLYGQKGRSLLSDNGRSGGGGKVQMCLCDNRDLCAFDGNADPPPLIGFDSDDEPDHKFKSQNDDPSHESSPSQRQSPSSSNIIKSSLFLTCISSFVIFGNRS